MRPIFSETNLNERPFLVFWEVTRACALACKHCRAVAQPRPHPDELTHEEALGLIDQLAELRPPMLVLTGGDPVMRPDILELIRAAAGKGLHVALSPAATARLLHADFHALKEAGVQSMSLSLDGAHEATHDAFRGVPHTYERTLRAAEMAKEAGMHLQINTTITRSTLGEFDDFVELMKKMEPGMWSVFLLVPTGRAAMDEMPTAEEVEAVWEKLSKVSREVPFGVKTTEGHHYRRVALQEACAPRHPHPGRQGDHVHLPYRGNPAFRLPSRYGGKRPDGRSGGNLPHAPPFPHTPGRQRAAGQMRPVRVPHRLRRLPFPRLCRLRRHDGGRQPLPLPAQAFTTP